MDDLSRLANLIVVGTNLLALAMSFGLIFAVLVQPRRDLTSYAFAGFCVSLGAWAITSLMGAVPQLRYGLADTLTVYMATTAIGLTAATFFVFITVFVKPEGAAAHWLIRATPLLLIVGLLLVWTGQAFVNIRLDVGLQNVDLTPIGYLILAVIVAYLLAGFWFLLRSNQERARLLRIPALILVVAYASNSLSALVVTPVDTVLATVAAVWMGWAVLHFQLFNPLTQLNQELIATNRDLQRAVDDLDREKRQTEQLNRELFAANQYKNEFVANMSHELRTPLNSIIGYSELLEASVYGDLNEKQRNRVEKIRRNGQHLTVLIDAILDLNKLDAGRLLLDKTPFPMQTVIEHLTAVFQPQCSARALEFLVNTHSPLPILNGDQRRIIQALSNLLNNAVKFTKTGNISLETQAVVVAKGQAPGVYLPESGLPDGNWVLVSITDTGIGIPADQQAHIFDPFSQADSGLDREFEGVGLGLAISRRLIEMHSGVIWLRSIVGEGSAFYVALPHKSDKLRVGAV